MLRRYVWICLLPALSLLTCGIKDDSFQKLEGGWRYIVLSKNSRLPIAEIQKLKFQPLLQAHQLADLRPDKEGIVYLKREFYLNQDLHYLPLALLTGRITWADRTYLNGIFLGGTGKFGPIATNNWNYNRYYLIGNKTIRPDATNVLLIEVYTRGEGSLSDIPLVGERKKIIRRYHILQFIRVYLDMLISFALLFFVFHYFLTYWKRPGNREYLYFALYILMFALYNSNNFLLALPGIPPIPYLLFQKVIWVILYTGLYMGLEFCRTFLRHTKTKWEKYIINGCILGSILIILVAPDYRSFLAVRAYTHVSVVLYPIVTIYWTVRAWKRRVPGVRGLALSLGILTFPLLHDVVAMLTDYTLGVFLSAFAFPMFLFTLSLTMATKFANNQNQLQIRNSSLADLNVTLEDQVLKRTEDLQRIVNDVQKLKAKQDGDFYLTSILLESFQVNKLNSQTVRAEFLTQQFNQFKYKKYSAELGGDLCACHTIHLGKRPMTLFVASDAMGKSMQGAGGALVLGSILTAIITHAGQRVTTELPMDWLREAFQEIDTVFCGFKGSMMVSMILGLVDDETGLVYYINADHPFPISIYNDEIRFLEDRITYHKAGMQGETYDGTVRTHQMREGESLLMGSDGKDDLRIQVNADETTINADDNLILTVIEETGLNLPAIKEELERRGELIDDLSLMVLSWRS